MSYDTGNPVEPNGSSDPRDLDDNAANLDLATNGVASNWTDRTGKPRKSWAGMEQDFSAALVNMGYIFVGTYAAGLVLSLPNQVFDRSGEYWRAKPGVPLPLTMTGTWATDSAKVVSVGDAALRSALAASDGGINVGFQGRNLNAKATDHISVEDMPGVNGGGTVDDLGVVNSAITASPGQTAIELRRSYRISTYPTNPTGKPFVGPGQLLLDKDGYQYQLNTYTHSLGLSMGREHLDKVFARLLSGSGQLRIQLYGDSTVAGHNGESAQFYSEKLIAAAFAQNGVGDAIVTNYGVPGSQWSDLNAIPNIDATAANTTDLLVIKYFINDFPKDLATILNTVRTKLAAIRAATNGDIHKLSIIVMNASTTYDLPNGRDSRWYEQLRNGVVQICQRYQCAFFDTYALMQDSTTAAGYWMDQPWAGQPWAVHMLNRGQNIVWNALVREFFPAEYLREVASNRFLNLPSTAGQPPESTGADSYTKGLNAYRATWAGVGDGATWMRRHADSIADQELIPFSGNNPIPKYRIHRIGSGWSVWSGVSYSLTSPTNLLGPKVSAYGGTRRAPGYHRDQDGRLCLEGSVTVTSAVVVGDKLTNALPVGFRVENGDQIGFASGSGGGVRLLFSTSGDIYFQSAVASGTEIALDCVTVYLG